MKLLKWARREGNLSFAIRAASFARDKAGKIASYHHILALSGFMGAYHEMLITRAMLLH